MMDIEIGEIVLDGVTPTGDFHSEFAAELTRLAGVHSGQLSGGEAPVLHAHTQAVTGTQVAQAVWGSMS